MKNDNLSNIKTGLMIWKTSNLWQKLIRNALKKYSLTFNEYTILEAIKYLKKSEDSISQVIISRFSGIDISVVSFGLKFNGFLELQEVLGTFLIERNMFHY